MGTSKLLLMLFATVEAAVLGEGILLNDKPSKQNLSADNCSSFPNGLKVESRYGDVGEHRWANQCPASTMMTATWSLNAQSHVTDFKCCRGNVDHTLSHPILDFHYFDKGVVEPNQPWQVECKPNHVITALHLSENPTNGYRTHVNAMKCSLLIDSFVQRQSCVRIDNAAAPGHSRLPNVTWSAQCPYGMAVVALFDSDGFKTIQYSKCCPIEASSLPLPFHCDFNKGSLCGWTQDIDDEVDWKYKGANGGNYHYISFDGESRGGVARLSSPGYSTPATDLCLKMSYFMSGFQPRMNVLLRYAGANGLEQNITTLAALDGPLGRPKDVDIIVSPKSDFQIIIEGVKSPDHVSLINIMDLKVSSASQCKVDACTPPSTGCGPNAHCIPVAGYLRCTCMKSHHLVNNQCQPINVPLPTAPVPRTTQRATLPTGSRNGGEGKNGVTGEITPPPVVTNGKATGGKVPPVYPGTDTKFKNRNGNSRLTNWMYIAPSAAAGILLTFVLILLFLVYRRRLLASGRRVSFDMELRHRPPVSDPVQRRISDGSRLTVPNGKLPSWQCRPFRSVSLGSAGSFVETNIGNSSPKSHHYFVVEPTPGPMERKVSEGLLSSPVYGSLNEMDEGIDADGDMFLEPPNDEKELRAQLKRELPRNCIRISVDKTLGQGAFGFVKLGSWKKRCGSFIKVAVKMLKEPATSDDRIMFLREAVIMSQFVHTNVVYMYGVMTAEFPSMIVLEYMNHGNLKKYLLGTDSSRNNSGVITHDMHCLFLRFARDIVAGMTYLSNLKFVHRDIAARNILLNENLTCKIGDFGLARDLIGRDHYTSQKQTFPVKWTAPEAILYKRFSSASDVWSYGVVLYEIWALGRKPYKDFDNRMVTDLVCNRRFRLPPPPGCPRLLYHIMIDCWHPEPKKRPRFSQLKYCLGQSDSRLIGKESTEGRRRSTTFSMSSLTTSENEDVYGDLQFTYCRTE